MNDEKNFFLLLFIIQLVMCTKDTDNKFTIKNEGGGMLT
jgi:hypothetical protein